MLFLFQQYCSYGDNMNGPGLLVKQPYIFCLQSLHATRVCTLWAHAQSLVPRNSAN